MAFAIGLTNIGGGYDTEQYTIPDIQVGVQFVPRGEKWVAGMAGLHMYPIMDMYKGSPSKCITVMWSFCY